MLRTVALRAADMNGSIAKMRTLVPDLDLEEIKGRHPRRQRVGRDGQPSGGEMCIECDADWPCEAATLLGEAERLRAALRHAVKVIQSYESDIRNSEWLGTDLVEAGFCQGSIYTDAQQDIQRIRDGETSGA